ncbi:uncharacterized protein LOC121780464 isoform X2 [Salvia splendens]|uniref:uncharacterized protein LOC121780464 isoform X2 n=1 Tax=Salvia splendens TaxID=180675 RepID=UPI001C257641|nr:uncharacterized protein LOC121780464 isoform X2 [Salvia splendens]
MKKFLLILLISILLIQEFMEVESVISGSSTSNSNSLSDQIALKSAKRNVGISRRGEESAVELAGNAAREIRSVKKIHSDCARSLWD